MEALQKLNTIRDPNRLALGQKLRVLSFPDADLVVHKKLQFADLMLKKQIDLISPLIIVNYDKVDKLKLRQPGDFLKAGIDTAIKYELK